MSGILFRVSPTFVRAHTPETYMDIKYLQPTLNQSQQRSTDKVACAILQEGLERSDETPHDHLNRNPSIRPKLLREKLRWQLSEQKDHQEDGLACIVVVCVHPQIFQHVVRHGLDYVPSVQLQRKECDACECTDANINLDLSLAS